MHGCKCCSETHKTLLFGAAVNEMDPLFCGWRDPRKSWVSGWICSAQLGWDFNLTLFPGVFNFCNFSVLRLNLAKSKEPMQPQTAYGYTCVCYFLCSSQQTFISVHCTRFAPREAFPQKNLWGLGELCAQNFPRVLWNMLHVEHKAHFTIPC